MSGGIPITNHLTTQGLLWTAYTLYPYKAYRKLCAVYIHYPVHTQVYRLIVCHSETNRDLIDKTITRVIVGHLERKENIPKMIGHVIRRYYGDPYPMYGIIDEDNEEGLDLGEDVFYICNDEEWYVTALNKYFRVRPNYKDKVSGIKADKIRKGLM